MDFQERAREAALEAQALLDRADAAGRSLTEGERVQCKRLLNEVNDLKIKAKIYEIGGPASSLAGGARTSGPRSSAPRAKDRGPGGTHPELSSGLVEVAAPFQAKGTLLEGTGSPGSGTGGGWVAAPFVVPG